MTNLNHNLGLVVLIACLVLVPTTVAAQSSSRDRPPGGSFVKRLDRDGDGRVSQHEFDGPAEHFSDFDRDGDGYLSEDEAPQGPPPGRSQGGQGGQNGQFDRGGQGGQGSQGSRGGQRGQGGQGGQGGGTGGFVDRLDRDGDGRVSRDEFDGPAKHFSDFDQDGDGYLSEDEAPQGPPPGGRGGRRGSRRDG